MLPFVFYKMNIVVRTSNLQNSETPLKGHINQRPTPLLRPLDSVNLNLNILISTPGERPPFWKATPFERPHILVAFREGLNFSSITRQRLVIITLRAEKVSDSMAFTITLNELPSV